MKTRQKTFLRLVLLVALFVLICPIQVSANNKSYVAVFNGHSMDGLRAFNKNIFSLSRRFGALSNALQSARQY